MRSAQEILKAIGTLDNVTIQRHRFGGIEFRYGKCELGHILRNNLVDIPFPKKIRDEIVNSVKAKAHHILPKSGWVSYYIQGQNDFEGAIELFMLSYKLATKKKISKSD